MFAAFLLGGHALSNLATLTHIPAVTKNNRQHLPSQNEKKSCTYEKKKIAKCRAQRKQK